MLAWKLCLAAAATALLAATAGRADDDAPNTTVVGPGQAAAVPGEVRHVPGAAPGVMTHRGEYWLGLIAEDPSPALQAQLKLPKDQGLVVEALQPESPAAKAGLQQYDVLLKGNDKPLTALHDLMHLIDQVKEGKLTLELLRAGKHETVIVTPAKRPANQPDVLGESWTPGAQRLVVGFCDPVPTSWKAGRWNSVSFIPDRSCRPAARG